MEPIVTVVMPVYNGMPHLKDSVASILAQTYEDFHFLIVDDGSADGTLEFLDSITDPRVEVVNQTNAGVTETVNRAVARAQTRFVARLDQDDIALPERLRQQVGFLLAHPEYTCVFGGIIRFTSNGLKFAPYHSGALDGFTEYESEKYGSIAPSTMCFRRDCYLELGGYRKSTYPADDYDLVLRWEEKYRIAVLNQPVVKYRICAGSITFQTFYDMRVGLRYVWELAARRRRGNPEISLTEFREFESQKGLAANFRTYFADYGAHKFRKAALLIGESRYLPGAFNLVMACAVSPGYSFGKLSATLTNRKKLAGIGASD